MYPDKKLYSVLIKADDSNEEKYVWAESRMKVRGYAKTSYEGNIHGIGRVENKPYIVESGWGIVDHSKEPPEMIDPDMVDPSAEMELNWEAPRDERTNYLRPSGGIDGETFTLPEDEDLDIEVDISVDNDGNPVVTFGVGEDEG
jgi:hypothetical protein